MTDNITCIFSHNDYFVVLSEKRKFKKLLNVETIVVNGKEHIGSNELDEIKDAMLKALDSK